MLCVAASFMCNAIAEARALLCRRALSVGRNDGGM